MRREGQFLRTKFVLRVGAPGPPGPPASVRPEWRHDGPRRSVRDCMRVALVQLATEVGNLAGNARAIREGIEAARAAGAAVALLPELALTGYPPLDLLLEHGFVAENLRLLRAEIAPAVRGIAAVVGFVERDPRERTPEGTPVLRNAAAVIEDGAVVGDRKSVV